MQPPPATLMCTTPSPFHEDLSVTLSAYSSVTEPRSEALVRNSNQQLKYIAALSTPQEVTGESKHQMVSPNNIQCTGS